MRRQWHEVDGWFTDKERIAIQPLAPGEHDLAWIVKTEGVLRDEQND